MPLLQSMAMGSAEDPGVLSAVAMASKTGRRPGRWLMTLPDISAIDKCLFRAVDAFLNHKYTMIVNLTFGTQLPQIVSLNIIGKCEVIRRECENLGIGIPEQQLGELLVIWCLAPDLEEPYVRITKEMVDEAAADRGAVEYSDEEKNHMVKWFNSAEAVWLHQALYDVLRSSTSIRARLPSRNG